MTLVQPPTQSGVSSLKALCNAGLENLQGWRLHKLSQLNYFHHHAFFPPLYPAKTSSASIYYSHFSISHEAF